ncbi:AraC family transcriptional regulator [Paenibacillus jiagnxiensis]|uniref:AraC family transcriptional regulator n=1 Tax=Paenibacillus jiagnxiensis TaxID=3228926 RepID=UPI0033B0BA56
MQPPLYTLFRPQQANGRTPSNKYMERPPSRLLAPFVACYWMSEPMTAESAVTGTAYFLKMPQEGAVDRVVPDGCSDILFVHDIRRNTYSILFSGFMDRPFAIDYDFDDPKRTFGVRFFPGGAHSLLGLPLGETANSHLALDAVWPELVREIGERVFEENSFAGKVRLMESFLLTGIGNGKTANDSLMSNLLYWIFTGRGNTSIQELAAREVISTRQMNRIFQQRIGTTPKRFSDVVRFQAAMNGIQKAGRIGGAAFALDYGYYDQAHMIRDFNRFYGASPLVALGEFGGMSDLYNPK